MVGGEGFTGMDNEYNGVDRTGRCEVLEQLLFAPVLCDSTTMMLITQTKVVRGGLQNVIFLFCGKGIGVIYDGCKMLHISLNHQIIKWIPTTLQSLDTKKAVALSLDGNVLFILRISTSIHHNVLEGANIVTRKEVGTRCEIHVHLLNVLHCRGGHV
ncbi:hypothetical protein Tco_0985001 [Tanacetum coccineum]